MIKKGAVMTIIAKVIMLVLFVILVALASGCGNGGELIEENEKLPSCYEVYSEAFCDSIRGVDGIGADGTNGVNGEDGADGTNGVNGEDGVNGTNGENGTDGVDGSDGNDGVDGSDGNDGRDGVGCTVERTLLDDGAVVRCGDDIVVVWDGYNGEDGLDAVIEKIDPCGKETDYDEQLWRFSDDSLWGVYSQGVKVHLVELIPGNYETTDKTKCNFEVTNDLDVVW